MSSLIGQRLETPTLQEAPLFADGGSERDVALLDPIRGGFGIGAARGEEILENLKDELVALIG